MGADGGYYVPSLTTSNGHEMCMMHDVNEFRVYSFGYFSGENPFIFPFPLLMLQIAFIMCLTRLAYYILKPLNMPRIVTDVLGGLLLCPRLLGRITVTYTDDVGGTETATLLDFLYPVRFFSVMRSTAAVGIMLYLFLVGVKINPRLIVQSGKKAWAIGVISCMVPFAFLGTLSIILRKQLLVIIPNSPFIPFIIATLTFSTFPVLADILMELHLLNSEMGRLAMSASMVHGIIGFVFMSIFIAINQAQGGATTVEYSLGYLACIIVIIAFLCHPLAKLIIKRTPKGGIIPEIYIYSILAVVLFMGFISDAIGASFVFAPFLMGLAIPEGPPLGAALVEKGQLLAAEVFMPLVYAAWGATSKISFIGEWQQWAILAFILFVGHFIKALATTLPAMYWKIPTKNAIILGLMMNFSGLVEVFTLLNLHIGGLILKRFLTLSVLEMMVVTGISGSLVKKYYSPFALGHGKDRRTIQSLKSHAELRVLACVHSEIPVPYIINLLEASAPANEMPLCVYVLHLIQIEGRVISQMISHKNKKGYIKPDEMDRLHNTFLALEQKRSGQIAVQPYTSITPLNTMHQDICALAAQKSVALIIVPFQRKHGEVLTDMDNAMQTSIPTIQSQAPCSVGILVYPDVVTTINQNGREFEHKVAVLFWGGPDDREVLSYASRMVRKVGVTLSIFYFVNPGDRRETKDRKLDENLLALVQYENANNSQLFIEEIAMSSDEQTVRAIKSIGNSGYDLTLVGRKQGENSLLNESMMQWCEYPQLGVVGDILASKDCEGIGSILVIEQLV